MLQALPDETAKRLASAQVAVSPDTVVKELVENALDAGSTSVQVRVKDAGLALISVKDDGCGVAPEDVPLLLQRYTTSKIASFDDLASVRTFGFRGEALNSIASLSVRTVVSTRVASEGSGRCYEFDRNRRMTGESAKAMQVGTQIEVEKLFHHLPVRKQSFAKQSTQVCKRIRDIMIGFALLFPKVRISVKFERTSSKSGPAGDDAANSITKSAVSTTLDAVRAVFGSALPKCLASFAAETSISPENAEWESHDERERISCQRIQIDALIPHKDHRSDAVVWKSSSDHCFVYVNSRRTALSSDPTIRELVARVRRRCAEGLDESKYPFMWIHIQLPVELTDVNIEPDKTTVKLRFPDQVLRCVELLLEEAYPAGRLPALFAASSSQVAGQLPDDRPLARQLKPTLLIQPASRNQAEQQSATAAVSETTHAPDASVATAADLGDSMTGTMPASGQSLGERLFESVNKGATTLDMESWSRGSGVFATDTRGETFGFQSQSPSPVVVAALPAAETPALPRTGGKKASAIEFLRSFAPGAAAAAAGDASATVLVETKSRSGNAVMGEGLENSKRKRRAASPGEADAFEEQRPPKPARKRKAAEELAPQPNGAGTLASALLRASQPRTQNRSAAAIKDLLVQQHHKNQTLHDARARYARLVASKRRRLQQPGHQLQATRESGIEVIGKIMPPPSDTAYPSCVAVQHMGSIWLLNMPRIEESILFGVLLETFKLPPDDLLLPVRLSAEQVGGPHIFQWLCGLPRSHQDGIIADERILANGFKLRVIEASETSMPETISAAEHVALELCGMSTAMRSLDIGDLREMLLLLHGELSQSGSSARDSHASHDLGTSRPAKTVRFFQERARTLARKRIENLEKQQTLAAEAAVAAGRLLQLQRRNHKRSRSTPLSARPSTLDPHWLCPHGREMIALLSEVPSHTRK